MKKKEKEIYNRGYRQGLDMGEYYAVKKLLSQDAFETEYLTYLIKSDIMVDILDKDNPSKQDMLEIMEGKD